ncbi:caspase family protein [Chitinophaga ginsengisoli]|uniref:Caspase domain-containing protein n=1 Tax=Chitinophaga ginsengisoli TaxID=363837 RepID=A0A2P8G2K7_9BACT|nr:caspase family protein [Chitinophaga ginsengisoli]PSL28187.1 caspase domain-containing protein [Chitinophaga ginsengisoli]
MRRALVVGIDEYPGGARLNGSVNDATSIEPMLSFNEDGSPNFEVMLMLNEKKKGTIMSRIKELFKGDDEVQLLYFSGHGYVNEIGGCMVTPDFQKHDEGISMDEILTLAGGSNARQKVVILDCCHAGAMGTPAIFGNGTALLGPGVVILAASRDTEVSREIGGKGVFTSLLLEALSGGAADIAGEVAAGSVYNYINRGLGAWQQRPVFKANIVRSVSLRKTKPPVDLSDLRKLTVYFPEATYEKSLDPSYESTVEGADSENIRVFKVLRRLQGVGLVEPVGEEYMYWAAIKSGSCRLTALGMYYWQLVKAGRI